MVQTLTRGQIAQLMGKLPLLSPPTVNTNPYVATDEWVGDTLDLNPSTVTTGFPIPSPLYTQTATVNGTSVGDATTYTVQSGDTGKNLVVIQSSSNIIGSNSKSSSTIIPVVVQKAVDQGLLGGNIGVPNASSVLQFLNNGGQGGKGLFFAFNNTGANYSGGFDSNGWPTSAFTYLISATSGGLDGQLPAGTYICSIRSAGQSATVTAFQSCTVSGVSLDADGITTHFTLVLPFAQNPCLSFSTGIQYLDIPRDGITPTYGGPEFWATNLAFFSQQGVIRLMDLCQSNITETTWADRNTSRPEYGPTQPSGVELTNSAASYSWERILRFIKAVVQYPGSITKQAWINPPGLMDTSQSNANNYAFQLPTLINSILGGVNVLLDIELGDEPWNASLGTAPVYTGNLNTAIAETQCLAYYVGLAGNISSIVGDGVGNVTVTTTSPLSAIPLPGGGTFAITNGMNMIADFQQGANSAWRAGSITPNIIGNYATDGTIVSVPITVLTTTSFQYAANGTPSGTLGATSGSNQAAFFFGLTSTLVKDGISMNIFDIGNKVQVRRTYQAQQIWSTIRSQDRFVLNLQQYGSTSAGAMTNSKFAFPYARYIGGGTDSWLYGCSVAPYVFATNVGFTGVATALGTTITGVPWAAQAQVGDQINIPGAGAAGAVLTTTVVSGSGTTLTVADTILTTVTAGKINYVSCAAASITASISGTTMTVTAGSGLLVGMMGNGTPSTLAFNTRILSQLTGTTGGVGTYQINNSQTVASTTIAFAQTDGFVNAMLSTIPVFAQTLASHIYTCSRWGKRAMCYEGGPDSQVFPTQQVAISTNPTMQTMLTALLSAWFNQGGQEFCFYNWTPATVVNAAEGEWQALQSYTDTSAPKHAALAGYGSTVLAYSNNFGAPGTYGPLGTAGAYIENSNLQSSVGWQGFFTQTGMLGTAGSSAERSVEVLFCIPRGRRYALQVSGSDSAIGTQLDVYVDGVFGSSPIGTVTLPNNGSGASTSTVPGNTNILQLGELTRGSHRIKVSAPAGRGTNVGIYSITLSKY